MIDLCEQNLRLITGGSKAGNNLNKYEKVIYIEKNEEDGVYFWNEIGDICGIGTPILLAMYITEKIVNYVNSKKQRSKETIERDHYILKTEMHYELNVGICNVELVDRKGKKIKTKLTFANSNKLIIKCDDGTKLEVHRKEGKGRIQEFRQIINNGDINNFLLKIASGDISPAEVSSLTSKEFGKMTEDTWRPELGGKYGIDVSVNNFSHGLTLSHCENNVRLGIIKEL